MNTQQLVTHALVFVIGVSVGLLLNMMAGAVWPTAAFVLGLGLILGYYARQKRA